MEMMSIYWKCLMMIRKKNEKKRPCGANCENER